LGPGGEAVIKLEPLATGTRLTVLEQAAPAFRPSWSRDCLPCSPSSEGTSGGPVQTAWRTIGRPDPLPAVRSATPGIREAVVVAQSDVPWICVCAAPERRGGDALAHSLPPPLRAGAPDPVAMRSACWRTSR
jgi:hypothetical protein